MSGFLLQVCVSKPVGSQFREVCWGCDGQLQAKSSAPPCCAAILPKVGGTHVAEPCPLVRGRPNLASVRPRLTNTRAKSAKLGVRTRSNFRQSRPTSAEVCQLRPDFGQVSRDFRRPMSTELGDVRPSNGASPSSKCDRVFGNTAGPTSRGHKFGPNCWPYVWGYQHFRKLRSELLLLPGGLPSERPTGDLLAPARDHQIRPFPARLPNEPRSGLEAGDPGPLVRHPVECPMQTFPDAHNPSSAKFGPKADQIWASV